MHYASNYPLPRVTDDRVSDRKNDVVIIPRKSWGLFLFAQLSRLASVSKRANLHKEEPIIQTGVKL